MKSTRDIKTEESTLQRAYLDIQEDRSKQYPSVTNLLYCITKTYWEHQYGESKQIDDTTKLYFVLGLGLEQALLRYRDETGRSGEKDGIYYHIDNIEDGVVVELKTTRMRTRRGRPSVEIGIEDYSEAWLKQIQAYCKVVGITQAKLVVIHIIEPTIQAWSLEFTLEELNANWDWLKQRKIMLEAAQNSGKAPTPFKYNMDWECGRCQWKVLCDSTGSRVG